MSNNEIYLGHEALSQDRPDQISIATTAPVAVLFTGCHDVQRHVDLHLFPFEKKAIVLTH